MEIELAKARLDLMNLDSQLMEAIQQKVELSQQLEQWEVSLVFWVKSTPFNVNICIYTSWRRRRNTGYYGAPFVN